MSETPSTHASEPEHPQPESIDIAADQARRKRRTLAVVAGVIVVAGGAIFGVTRYQEAENKREIGNAWAVFSRCLIGPPLEANERPSQRIRNVQLTGTTMTDQERTLPGSDKPWPFSCAPLGHALQEKLKAAGRADANKKDLAHWAEALAKSLADPGAPNADHTAAIEALFDQAKEAGITGGNDANAPQTPAAAHPMTATFLATVEPLSRASFTLKGAHTDAHPAGALRILVEEKDVANSPFLCTIDAKNPTARCKKLPSEIANGHGLRLYGTADDDSAPIVYAGDHGQAGIFRADTGEKLDAMYSYGGFAKADGSAAALGYNGNDHNLHLVRKTPNNKPTKFEVVPPFELGNFYYSTQILWDHLLFRAVVNNDRRLYAGKYAWSGDPVPSYVDVGQLPEPGLILPGDEIPHITGCRSPQGMVVRVRGYDNDFMSFLIGGKWTPPISPDFTGGVLSCHGTEAVITRLEPSASSSSWKTTVTQTHCTSAGCQATQVLMEKLLKGRVEFAPHEGKIDAVDLDGKLLLVWVAGERGGVRMRLAKPDMIAQAEDHILYDDLVKDGQVGNLSTLFDIRLFSRDGFAVALLNTSAGVHALRIDPGGKVEPITVTWEK